MADDITIVGGGFAGLTAAVALSAAGRRVRLLEQKPHLGGRARSFVEPTTGSMVDNGQHIFMGCYRSTIRFLKEIGTLDRIAFQSRLSVKFIDSPGRVTELTCPELPSPWHLLVGVLRSSSFTAREKMEILFFGKAFDSGQAARNGFERMSVDEWLCELGQSEALRRNFWDLLCIAAMNEDPRRAAALVFERVLRLALFNSQEDSRIGIPRVGLSDCYTEAAQRFITAHDGRVELGCGVAAFIFADGACRGVRLADGAEIEASAVVSAAPWHELARLLPEELLRSEPFFGGILSLRPAPIISIYLWFDQPVTDVDFAGLRGTTVQWIFNRRQIPNAGPNCVSLVLSGARDHMGRSKEALLEIALRDLRALLPAAREAQMLRALVIKERFATFSPTYDAERVRPPAQTPVRGLYFAGDWTATGLPATIEGAVQSGYTAADEVLRSSTHA